MTFIQAGKELRRYELVCKFCPQVVAHEQVAPVEVGSKTPQLLFGPDIIGLHGELLKRRCRTEIQDGMSSLKYFSGNADG